MTLRLSSLFEIHIKQIITSWNSNKKYYKKRNKKDVTRNKTLFSPLQRKKSFNGMSDSSDDDSYKEIPRKVRAPRKSKAKNAHISSQSSRDKKDNYSDSESCSAVDSSNSDDISSKGQNKDDQENGIDSEDSYKPKQNHTVKGNNIKNPIYDDDLNHSKRNGKEKGKRKYLGVTSSNSENEKQSEERVIRGRQTKSSMYNKLPSTSRCIITDTDNSKYRNLRSGFHNKENEECLRNSNCRPKRLNSRKKYMEQKKSDEEKSQEVSIIQKYI